MSLDFCKKALKKYLDFLDLHLSENMTPRIPKVLISFDWLTSNSSFMTKRSRSSIKSSCDFRSSWALHRQHSCWSHRSLCPWGLSRCGSAVLYQLLENWKKVEDRPTGLNMDQRSRTTFSAEGFMQATERNVDGDGEGASARDKPPPSGSIKICDEKQAEMLSFGLQSWWSSVSSSANRWMFIYP